MKERKKTEKLFYISNARMPTEKAHGYQIFKMCSEYAKRGFSVELIVPSRKNPISQDPFEFYGADKIFKVTKVSVPDFIMYSAYLGRWAALFQSIAFVLRIMFMNLDKRSLLITRHPELVWIAKRKKMRAAYECHDWFRRRIWFPLFLVRRVDCIIATNSFIRDAFVENGFDRGKMLVAPNGVDLGVFRIDMEKTEAIKTLSLSGKTKGILQNKNVLLYTGSFKTVGEEKGIKTILEALRFLNISVHFLAVGGNDKDIKEYEREAEKMGMKGRVTFLGRKTQSELAFFQRVSSILLMPFPRRAHYEYHMSPLKMFEYMASGRPIIASDLPSIREVLNESNAVLVPPGDSFALAEAIERLLCNPDLACRLAKRALEDVKEFTWERRAERILNKMRELNMM